MNEREKKLVTISLGWGLQSWTLAAMSALGDLPKIDFAIHADTGWEKSETYEFAKEWTSWLEKRGVKVVTVSDESAQGMIKDGWKGTFIPAFTINPSGSRGQLRRQCTSRWKIIPIRRWIADELQRRGWKKTPGIVETWMGITLDEFHRAKDSDVKYITHKFPFLDLGMSRVDCKTWLNEHDLPTPIKSSCSFCPYQNDHAWRRLKQVGNGDFQIAVEADSRIRDQRPRHPLFVHPARVPLAEAVKVPEDYDARQLSFFDLDGFPDDDAECDSGYCFL